MYEYIPYIHNSRLRVNPFDTSLVTGLLVGGISSGIQVKCRSSISICIEKEKERERSSPLFRHNYALLEQMAISASKTGGAWDNAKERNTSI